MPFARAFVAVDPEADDRLWLVALLRTLAATCPQGWLHADDLHLTLRFLGDLDRSAAEAVAAACDRLASATSATALAARGIEAWPPARPQALVLSLLPAEPIAALQRALQALPPAASRDRRRWRPHITLRRGGMPAIPAADPVAGVPPRITCRRIALFARHEGGGGQRYRRIASWSLRGRPSGVRH